MRRRRITTLAALLTGAALVASGCTSSIGGTALTGESEGRNPAAPERGPAPDPRDADAVALALRQIDACALLDTDLAAERSGAPDDEIYVAPRGPHACLLSVNGEYDVGSRPLEVRVGTPFDQLDRYHAEPITLAGAKAYQTRQTSGSDHVCTVNVPTSYHIAVEFHYSHPESGVCEAVRAYAEVAVDRLREPDTLTLDPATRPFSQWDGCAFLRTLLGTEAEYVFTPDGLYDPFSGCEAVGEQDDEVVLETEYDWHNSPLGEPTELEGTTVHLYDSSYACTATWGQAESGVDNEYLGTLTFSLETPSCDRTSALTTEAIGLADTRPESTDVSPQRPLLYGPDERDTGAQGACAHFGAPNGQADCAPYEGGTDVPSSADEIMATAVTEPGLQCAVFADAVAEVYGAEFQPLTWSGQCLFVEPTHQLRLDVTVHPAYRPADYGKDTSLWTDREIVEIAGKQAVSFYTTDGASRDIYVSPTGAVEARGIVHVNAQALPPRGEIAADPEPAPEKLAKAEDVLTRVIERHFA